MQERNPTYSVGLLEKSIKDNYEYDGRIIVSLSDKPVSIFELIHAD